MDYRALLRSSLLSIGVDPELVHQIERGAEIYGDAGLLDSVYLVGLIAAIEEALTRDLELDVDLFSKRGAGLLDEFKNANTLVSFLERRMPSYTATRNSVEDR
jgi:acyl carrier protein